MRCNFRKKTLLKWIKSLPHCRSWFLKRGQHQKVESPVPSSLAWLGISLPTCRRPKGFWTVCSGFFCFHARAQGSRIGRVRPVTRGKYDGGCKGKLPTLQVNRQNDFLPSGDCRTRKNSHQARATLDEVPKKEQIPQHTAKPRQRGKRCRLRKKKTKRLVEEAISIHPRKTHWRERATLLLLGCWGRGRTIQENHRGRIIVYLKKDKWAQVCIWWMTRRDGKDKAAMCTWRRKNASRPEVSTQCRLGNCLVWQLNHYSFFRVIFS